MRFRAFRTLKSHFTREHPEAGPFINQLNVCNECNKTFELRANLKEHMKCHKTGNKPLRHSSSPSPMQDELFFELFEFR